jgi:hypothetical protein
MFLDCPAYLDQDGTVRCGLPAEVRYRFTMRSSDGPLESAMIRCPAGHWFSGPIGSLTWDSKNEHDPGTAAAASTARHGSLPRTHDGRDSGGGSALPDLPAEPGPAVRRPNCALPAIWGGPPANGSPPCAAAAPHPATPCTPLPAAGRERHLPAAAWSPAPGPDPPAWYPPLCRSRGDRSSWQPPAGHMRSSPGPHRASAPPSPPAWPPTATT